MKEFLTQWEARKMISARMIVCLMVTFFYSPQALGGDKQVAPVKVNHYLVSLAKAGTMKRYAVLLAQRANKMQSQAQKLKHRASILERKAQLDAKKSAQLKVRYLTLLKKVQGQMRKQIDNRNGETTSAAIYRTGKKTRTGSATKAHQSRYAYKG